MDNLDQVEEQLKKEKKKKQRVSGKSVFKIKDIIEKRADNKLKKVKD